VSRLAEARNKHRNYAEKQNVILEQAHRLGSLSAFSTWPVDNQLDYLLMLHKIDVDTCELPGGGRLQCKVKWGVKFEKKPQI